MKLRVLALSAAFVVSAAHGGVRAQSRRGDPASAPDCTSLAVLKLPRVRITEAVSVAKPASGAITVAHCKVAGEIDGHIGFVALLPDRWNGRLFAGGGGGFVGKIDNDAETAVNLGYATIGTDTGHQAPDTTASWALGRRDLVVDFGYRAVHRTTAIAKALVRAYYQRPPARAYFFGCSNGGREALMEAQRYPDDFDGIVSFAPAFDFTNIAVAFVSRTQALYPNPRALDTAPITPDNLKLLQAKALDACDALDGVKDGVIDDPRHCRFTAADLPACSDDRPADSCVTTAERDAIARVYAAVRVGGEVVYPGQPVGAEADSGGWQPWLTGIDTAIAARTHAPMLDYAFGTEFFKYFVFGRADWDYSTYNLSRWRTDTRAAAAVVDADNPDLSAFASRGGRLILAHGWADPALNPLATIGYYERVRARAAHAADHVRLFLMPGVLHCGGGPGPDDVDWYDAIAEWVEHANPPSRLLARKLGANGAVVNARPLCAYPQHAVYDGKGSTTDAASFICR